MPAWRSSILFHWTRKLDAKENQPPNLLDAQGKSAFHNGALSLQDYARHLAGGRAPEVATFSHILRH